MFRDVYMANVVYFVLKYDPKAITETESIYDARGIMICLICPSNELQ